MNFDEFQRGIERLRTKWPNVATVEQAKIFWNRWSIVPGDVFAQAIESVLFKSVHCPSGERIEEIILETKAHTPNQEPQSASRNNGCVTCSGHGHLTAQNHAGNEILFLCTSCEGKGLSFNYELPRWFTVQSLGYAKKRLPLSHKARQLPEWKEPDTTKYSPKLIGVFNTVQRALLTKDTRGINGIKKLLGVNSADLMKVYTLMYEGITEHDLIKKFSSKPLEFNKAAR